MKSFQPDTLQITIEPMPARGVTLLHLSGPIDGRTAPNLELALQSLFAQANYRIIMDLAEVNHISSAGVGVLVSTAAVAEEHNGGLIFMNINENTCGNALKLVGLWDFMKRAPDLAGALTMFSHASSSSMGMGVKSDPD